MDGEGSDPFGGMDIDLDFDIPDMSAMRRTMSLISWLPALILGFFSSSLVFLFFVIYNGLSYYDYNITYGSFMWLFVLSIGTGVFVLLLVKFLSALRAS